jgi:hypothetical protein
MASKRKSTSAAIDELSAKLAALDRPRCRKLLHCWFSPDAPSAPTSGCPACARVRAEYDAWTKANPPAPAPKPPVLEDDLS